jgi:hypothetical protein
MPLPTLFLPPPAASSRRNRNGLIDQSEFRAGLGDLGPQGDAAKDFVFDRVNRTSQSNGQLDLTNFGNALLLARTMILGY